MYSSHPKQPRGFSRVTTTRLNIEHTKKGRGDSSPSSERSFVFPQVTVLLAEKKKSAKRGVCVTPPKKKMPFSLSFVKSISMRRDFWNPNIRRMPNKSGPIAQFDQMVSHAHQYYPETEVSSSLTYDGTPGEIIIDWVTGDRNHYFGDSLVIRNILEDMNLEQNRLNYILTEREIVEEKESFEDTSDLNKPKEKKDGKKDTKGGKEEKGGKEASPKAGSAKKK